MKNKVSKIEGGSPCSHMEGLLNHAAKGTGSRLGKWYALAHAARCGPCRKFLENLELVLDQLKKAKSEELSDSKATELMQKFAQAKEENP